MFCTLFYGILDTETGEITYANAGHNPPYLMTPDGKTQQIETTGGIALGVMEDMAFEMSTITLHTSCSIYLYTDGINEAMDLQNKEYSYKRLESYLNSSTNASVSEIVDGSLDSVNDYVGSAPQSDDMTVLAIKYLGNHK